MLEKTTTAPAAVTPGDLNPGPSPLDAPAPRRRPRDVATHDPDTCACEFHMWGRRLDAIRADVATLPLEGER